MSRRNGAPDAILTGIGTVMTDNPLLTDRSGLLRRRPLLRVVVDSTLRISAGSALVDTARDDLIVFCATPDTNKKTELEGRGVEVVQLDPAPNRKVDLGSVLRHLAARQIASVLLEGGATLNGAMLSAGLVDKVFLFVAPKILGDVDAVPLAAGTGFASVAQAATLHELKLLRFGEDFAVEGYFRDPYGLLEQAEL